jgi:hypothetical protein
VPKTIVRYVMACVFIAKGGGYQERAAVTEDVAEEGAAEALVDVGLELLEDL